MKMIWKLLIYENDMEAANFTLKLYLCIPQMSYRFISELIFDAFDAVSSGGLNLLTLLLH